MLIEADESVQHQQRHLRPPATLQTVQQFLYSGVARRRILVPQLRRFPKRGVDGLIEQSAVSPQPCQLLRRQRPLHRVAVVAEKGIKAHPSKRLQLLRHG